MPRIWSLGAFELCSLNAKDSRLRTPYPIGNHATGHLHVLHDARKDFLPQEVRAMVRPVDPPSSANVLALRSPAYSHQSHSMRRARSPPSYNRRPSLPPLAAGPDPTPNHNPGALHPPTRAPRRKRLAACRPAARVRRDAALHPVRRVAARRPTAALRRARERGDGPRAAGLAGQGHRVQARQRHSQVGSFRGERKDADWRN